MITVVAALVQHNGRILICQRRRHDTLGLKWEFPGGKLKAGETPAQALRRELEEELGVAATIGVEIHRTRHRYARAAEELELVFLTASLPADGVRNLAFEQLRWVRPGELGAFDFLPADRELVARLASGELELS